MNLLSESELRNRKSNVETLKNEIKYMHITRLKQLIISINSNLTILDLADQSVETLKLKALSLKRSNAEEFENFMIFVSN